MFALFVLKNMLFIEFLPHYPFVTCALQKFSPPPLFPCLFLKFDIFCAEEDVAGFCFVFFVCLFSCTESHLRCAGSFVAAHESLAVACGLSS